MKAELIDRQRAIDEFYMDTCDVDKVEWAENVLKRVPSAEPKQGEWLEVSVSEIETIEEWQSARCSYCGLYHTTPYMYYVSLHPYCPSCGAKMQRKETTK